LQMFIDPIKHVFPYRRLGFRGRFRRLGFSGIITKLKKQPHGEDLSFTV